MKKDVLPALKKSGCDTDGSLRRLDNDEQFYLNLLETFAARLPGDLVALRAALGAKDTETAFKAAHSLKGVLANLGLTTLLVPAQTMTEILRSGTCEGADAYMDELDAKKDAFLRIMQEN